MVIAQGGISGGFSDKEKRLICGYFIAIDEALKTAEAQRVQKNARNTDHKWDNKLPYTWKNVDCDSLAQYLAHYAKVGLDMQEDNTLFAIPYKNSASDKYIMTLIEGYNGIRFQALKYAAVPFKDVIVEVVYSTDKFKPLKRDANHPVETYEFEITSPFDRGEPIGVFGYIVYEDASMNKLVVFSKADVEKRKPKNAGVEFWGGKRTIRKDGKDIEIESEGWVHEMYEKTMKREIYSAKHIARDPEKADAALKYIMAREKEYGDIVIESEMAEKANSQPLAMPKPEPDKPELPKATDIPVPDVHTSKPGLEDPGF